MTTLPEPLTTSTQDSLVAAMVSKLPDAGAAGVAAAGAAGGAAVNAVAGAGDAAVICSIMRDDGEMGLLDGELAIVTGGGAGIGRATCERFAQEGARVAVLDIDPESAAQVAADVGGVAVVADVADPEQCARGIAEAHTALGGLTILVNNAGVGAAMPLLTVLLVALACYTSVRGDAAAAVETADMRGRGQGEIDAAVKEPPLHRDGHRPEAER